MSKKHVLLEFLCVLYPCSVRSVCEIPHRPFAHVCRHPGRTLVFVNAISSVRRVAAILKQLGLPAHALHAQQQQRQRLKAVDRFRAHEQAVLVATDVAARGLDIKGVR